MIHTKECSVYPGEYTLMLEAEALMKELNVSSNSLGTQPLVNMEELDDCFEAEMIVPCAKREDLSIKIKDNILSVIVLHKHCELNKKLQIHKFDTDCSERHMLLPENADVEFISAEYTQGILRMHIPKNQHPFHSGIAKQVVIY